MRVRYHYICDLTMPYLPLRHNQRLVHDTQTSHFTGSIERIAVDQGHHSEWITYSEGIGMKMSVYEHWFQILEMDRFCNRSLSLPARVGHQCPLSRRGWSRVRYHRPEHCDLRLLPIHELVSGKKSTTPPLFPGIFLQQDTLVI